MRVVCLQPNAVQSFNSMRVALLLCVLASFAGACTAVEHAGILSTDERLPTFRHTRTPRQQGFIHAPDGRREHVYGRESHRIGSICPSRQMSCFPGCAIVSDTLMCGPTLLAAAGGLAVALAYIAREHQMTIEEICQQHSTLCTEVEPTTVASEKEQVGKRPCLFNGAGGKGLFDPSGKAGPIECRYNCGGVTVKRMRWGTSDDVCMKDIPVW